MKIVSFNANGIRSAANKGFFDWMDETQPDIVCIQETKAQRHQLDAFVFHPQGYMSEYVDAVKPGYSGVAIYSRYQPQKITRKMRVKEFDDEGRFLQFDFGPLAVASVYFPSGSSGETRQEAKYRFLAAMKPKLNSVYKKSRRHAPVETVLCGDWNIAHKEIDLKNWKGNKKNSGFLPEERAWMDDVFAPTPKGIGLIDVFRTLNQKSDQYTWWSNRGQAYAKNVGWRIDYQVATPGIATQAQSTSIYKDQKFSDHAPLIMTYDLNLDCPMV